MPRALDHDRLTRAIALAICAFAYLYVFPYQARINNPNENVRFYMTAALVEEQRYEIDSLRERWGWVNDAATRDGHYYSVKAPGTSFLGVPGYALYRAFTQLTDRPLDRVTALWWCRAIGSMLPTLLWLAWLLRWLERRSHDRALVLAAFFSVALGSLLYGYAMLFVSHTLSAVAAFGAFMLLADIRAGTAPPSWLRAGYAGLLAAGTTLLEYPGLPASVVLSLYALFVLWPRARVRGCLAFGAGALVPTLAMMHFQHSAFGNAFTPGHRMVENEAFRHIHEKGFYGAVGPSAEALQGLLIDLGAGLFPLTPLLMLAPIGLFLMIRDRNRRAEGIAVLAVCVLTTLGIASMDNWRGGWTIGPRYLALCVPFMAWAALIALEPLAQRARTHAIAIAVGATAVGLVASGLPSAYYPHLPPEITRPLPQLLAILIAHDYAPPNAGALAGVFGTASMLPLFVAQLAALALCLFAIGDRSAQIRASALAVLAALALSLPLWMRPASEPGVSEAVAFITRRWSPTGHDAAETLRARLRAQASIDQASLTRLADLYATEGRTREAAAARRGKL